MFGIPGKQAVTMTEAAAAQIRKLMEAKGHKGLRIGVKKAAVRAWSIRWNMSMLWLSMTKS